MTVMEHLKELRNRLIISIITFVIGSIICFYRFNWIVNIMFEPFAAIEGVEILDGNILYVNSIFEGFSVKIKMALIAGGILTLPMHLYQIIAFILPALLKHEKVILISTVISGCILAPVGFYYAYYYIIPLSVGFLTGLGFIPENVGLMLNYNTNIFYIMKFLFAFVLVFQIPLLLVVLMKFGIIKRKFLMIYSKYIIIMFFVLSAVITPPDVVSQIAIAAPLIILFYLSIVVAKICGFGEENV